MFEVEASSFLSFSIIYLCIILKGLFGSFLFSYVCVCVSGPFRSGRRAVQTKGGCATATAQG